MLARSLRKFTAYRPDNCFFITAEAAGEELSDHDTVRYLIETHCPDVEPADDEATELAARFAPPPASPVAAGDVSATSGDVTVRVGEDGPELVVAGGIAVTPVTATDPTPYNAAVEHPVEGGSAGDESAPTSFDPTAHTVEEVLAYVAEHPEERLAVLAQESAGKVRTTIVKALSA